MSALSGLRRRPKTEAREEGLVLRQTPPEEVERIKEARKTQGLGFLKRLANKLIPGERFDFKPDTAQDVREEARTSVLRETGALKSLKVRTPFGTERDAVFFPPSDAGKVKSFVSELAFRATEIIPKLSIELTQAFRDIHSGIRGEAPGDPLQLSFNAQRIGEQEKEFQGAARNFDRRWNELDAEGGNSLLNGYKAFGTEVVPVMFDALITGDLVNLAAKGILAKTKFNPQVDEALNQLGFTRGSYIRSTPADFKKEATDILSETLRKGDLKGTLDTLNAITVIGREMEAGGILELNKFGRALQEISRKMSGPLSDINKVAGTRPIGTPRVGLPGTRRAPGQAPAFGLSTEEIESVGKGFPKSKLDKIAQDFVDKKISNDEFKKRAIELFAKETAAVKIISEDVVKDAVAITEEVGLAVEQQVQQITDLINSRIAEVVEGEARAVAVPKDVEPLAVEARKFNTAEEFVAAQPKVFHGTSAELTEFDEGVGAFFTDDFFIADGFASGENVFEGVLSFKNPKIIDAKGRKHDDLDNKLGSSTQEIISNVDSKKHDGVIFKNINDAIFDDAAVDGTSTVFFAFNPRKTFLNESQLTDIFNQAKAEGKFLKGIEADVKKGITKKRFDTAQRAKAVEKGEVRGGKVQKKIEQRVTKRQVSVEIRERTRALKAQKLSNKENQRELIKIEREKAEATLREIKKNKDNKLKDYKKGLESRQKEALKLVEKLPKDLRGRMNQAITQATTDARVTKLSQRVQRRLSEFEARQAISESKGLAKNAQTAKITPRFQRLIDDVKSEYDFKKPTEKTIKRLRATREFLEKNPDYPIPEKYVEEIKRLEKTNLKDLGVGRVEVFNDVIRRLTRLGEEVQKHRVIVNRLKFERELKSATEKTVNLDTRSEKLNKLIKAENATEFTFRVADKTDGSQFYKGWHAKFVKEMGQGVNKAEIEQANRMFNFFQEHKKIGETTLSEIEQKQVAAHLYNDQGGTEQVAKILKDLGVDKLPTLSKEQEQVRDLLVKTAKQKTDKVQPLWETTMVDENGRPMAFGVHEKYFPFAYEERASEIGIYSILQDYKVQSKIQFGAGLERKAGVDLTPRTDIYKMLQESVAKQEIFINIQPGLFEKGTIFRTKEYQDVAGNINTEYWVGYIDEMSRSGMSSNAVRTPIDGFLRKGRQNISRGLLDLSFSSAAIQPLAIIDAMAYMITYMPKATVFKLAGNFTQAFIRPNFVRDTVEKSLALQTRKGGEEVIASFDLNKIKKNKRLTPNVWQAALGKITKPFGLLQFFDLRTAAAVQRTVVDELSKTLTREAAEAEADFIMDLVSGSSNIAYRPRIMNQGEIGRTLTTFQTFVLNEWGLITQDIIKKGIFKGGPNNDIKTRLWAMVALGLVFLQAHSEDKLRNAINNAVRGTEYESNSALKTALIFIPERIPLLGNIISGIDHGKEGLPVVIFDVFSNILKGAIGVASSEETKDKLVNLSKMIESTAILALGVPGAKEAQNIIERLIKGSEIGEETLQSLSKDVLEQITANEIGIEEGKKLIDKGIERIKSAEDKKRLELSPKEFAKDMLARIDSGEITLEEGKKELEKFTKEKDKKEPLDVGFFSSLILVAKGATVDPANVLLAIRTKEKLELVDGNLVALQRDFGEPYKNPDGSLNPEGSSGLKKELARELGIPLDDLPEFGREHIVPVKAGGSNQDDNLQLIPIELHKSYTPLDIAVGKAVRAEQITRKDAEKLMRSLKVDLEITVSEAFDRLEELKGSPNE